MTSLSTRLLVTAAITGVFSAAYRLPGGPGTLSPVPPAAAASGSAIALEADDSYFDPTCESGVPAGEVELQVKNTGRLLHNISFEDEGIDQDVGPGAGMVGALLPR